MTIDQPQDVISRDNVVSMNSFSAADPPRDLSAARELTGFTLKTVSSP